MINNPLTSDENFIKNENKKKEEDFDWFYKAVKDGTLKSLEEEQKNGLVNKIIDLKTSKENLVDKLLEIIFDQSKMSQFPVFIKIGDITLYLKDTSDITRLLDGMVEANEKNTKLKYGIPANIANRLNFKDWNLASIKPDLFMKILENRLSQHGLPVKLKLLDNNDFEIIINSSSIFKIQWNDFLRKFLNEESFILENGIIAFFLKFLLNNPLADPSIFKGIDISAIETKSTDIDYFFVDPKYQVISKNNKVIIVFKNKPSRKFNFNDKHILILGIPEHLEKKKKEIENRIKEILKKSINIKQQLKENNNSTNQTFKEIEKVLNKYKLQIVLLSKYVVKDNEYSVSIALQDKRDYSLDLINCFNIPENRIRILKKIIQIFVSYGEVFTKKKQILLSQFLKTLGIEISFNNGVLTCSKPIDKEKLFQGGQIYNIIGIPDNFSYKITRDYINKLHKIITRVVLLFFDFNLTWSIFSSSKSISPNITANIKAFSFEISLFSVIFNKFIKCSFKINPFTENLKLNIFSIFTRFFSTNDTSKEKKALEETISSLIKALEIEDQNSLKTEYKLTFLKENNENKKQLTFLEEIQLLKNILHNIIKLNSVDSNMVLKTLSNEFYSSNIVQQIQTFLFLSKRTWLKKLSYIIYEIKPDLLIDIGKKFNLAFNSKGIFSQITVFNTNNLLYSYKLQLIIKCLINRLINKAKKMGLEEIYDSISLEKAINETNDKIKKNKTEYEKDNSNTLLKTEGKELNIKKDKLEKLKYYENFISFCLKHFSSILITNNLWCFLDIKTNIRYKKEDIKQFLKNLFDLFTKFSFGFLFYLIDFAQYIILPIKLFLGLYINKELKKNKSIYYLNISLSVYLPGSKFIELLIKIGIYFNKNKNLCINLGFFKITNFEIKTNKKLKSFWSFIKILINLLSFKSNDRYNNIPQITDI